MQLQLNKVVLLLFWFSSLMLHGQKEQISAKDSGFQLTALSIPKQAPNGYTSVHTVALDKPLYPKKAYEIGFWIFGKQLRNQGYSYPINVFPSNFMDHIDETIFDQVKSVEILPVLEVLPPPSYSGRGHFTFVIRPDTIYNHLTIVLKNKDWVRPLINFQKDVTVTGVFVKPLREQKKKEEKVTVEEITPASKTVPKIIAERILIDSKKSYSVTEENISISLYDHRNIDKDRVTIYLNDKIIVKNLELRRKKKTYDIKLRLGENIITLHAENLGEVAPNTAAILIKSKLIEYEAILVSDLKQSQYFTLILETQ